MDRQQRPPLIQPSPSGMPSIAGTCSFRLVRHSTREKGLRGAGPSSEALRLAWNAAAVRRTSLDQRQLPGMYFCGLPEQTHVEMTLPAAVVGVRVSVPPVAPPSFESLESVTVMTPVDPTSVRRSIQPRCW